jgi:hypothetical protein
VVSNPQAALESLLNETETAHGRYEASELGGIYDERWADWYARRLIERGYNHLVKDDTVDAEGLSALLIRLFEDYKASGSGEKWSAYFARVIIGDRE